MTQTKGWGRGTQDCVCHAQVNHALQAHANDIYNYNVDVATKEHQIALKECEKGEHGRSPSTTTLRSVRRETDCLCTSTPDCTVRGSRVCENRCHNIAMHDPLGDFALIMKDLSIVHPWWKVGTL